MRCRGGPQGDLQRTCLSPLYPPAYTPTHNHTHLVSLLFNHSSCWTRMGTLKALSSHDRIKGIATAAVRTAATASRRSSRLHEADRLTSCGCSGTVAIPSVRTP